jgi:hypothetical protein
VSQFGFGPRTVPNQPNYGEIADQNIGGFDIGRSAPPRFRSRAQQHAAKARLFGSGDLKAEVTS